MTANPGSMDAENVSATKDTKCVRSSPAPFHNATILSYNRETVVLLVEVIDIARLFLAKNQGE